MKRLQVKRTHSLWSTMGVMVAAVSIVLGAAPSAFASSSESQQNVSIPNSWASSVLRASSKLPDGQKIVLQAAPSTIKPDSAGGCTTASIAIKLCIGVTGTGNVVDYVDAEKDFNYGYVNACDSVSLIIRGGVYATSGRFCSAAGTYLSHRFYLYESFTSGTSVCVRWDSYPTHQPCETIG